MQDLLTVMSFLAPIILGLTQLSKKYIPSKYYPLISIVLGVVLAPLTHYLNFVSMDISMGELLWAGLLAGMSSSGLYSAQNAMKK